MFCEVLCRVDEEVCFDSGVEFGCVFDRSVMLFVVLW